MMTTIGKNHLPAPPAMQMDAIGEPSDIPGTHPSPSVFPVGFDSAGEQVCWNTSHDPNLFILGSVVDGLDTVLHHLSNQARNHENRWNLYSANAFGAGKHAHGLTETAWHKGANLNLYITMIEELNKIYHDRKKAMRNYRMDSFADLRRATRVNSLLVIMPDLADIIADLRPEVQNIGDMAYFIATHGYEVGIHGVFVFDKMGDNQLYSEILNNASSIVLRNMSDNSVFGDMVTQIPHEKGYGLFKTNDNTHRSFFHTL